MIEDAPDTTTGIMIDALQYPLDDKTISVTTRARPFINELLAEAWDAGFTERAHEGTRQHEDPTHPIIRVNPYRSQP